LTGEIVNLLLKPENLLCKFLLDLLVVLYIGLYVLLVSLYALDQLSNLLVSPLHQLLLGVYGVATSTGAYIPNQLGNRWFAGLKKRQCSMYLVKEFLIVLLVYGIDYLFLRLLLWLFLGWLGCL
jgi:hypothetical protein